MVITAVERDFSRYSSRADIEDLASEWCVACNGVRRETRGDRLRRVRAQVSLRCPPRPEWAPVANQQLASACRRLIDGVAILLNRLQEASYMLSRQRILDVSNDIGDPLPWPNEVKGAKINLLFRPRGIGRHPACLDTTVTHPGKFTGKEPD